MKKVFYDGNCPICNREIGLYKSLVKINLLNGIIYIPTIKHLK